MSNLFSPSEKRSTLKGKNLLPLGANSYLLEKDFFSEAACSAGKQTESHKHYLSCGKWGNIHQVYLVPFKVVVSSWDYPWYASSASTEGQK